MSDAESPDAVGGKARNLLRLRDAGFDVPRFWIVPRVHFDRAVAAGIVAYTLPEELAASLLEALPPGRLFAVRSSALGEDSRESSFAGVLESVLNVPRDGVPAALVRVWASAFSARARLYRERLGLAPEDAATAVVVQEMVQADRAGVLFTRDPQDGARAIVIAAGLGLGPGVVEDTVETDTYRVGWDDGRAHEEVREKRSRIVLADAATGGVREDAVPPRDRRRPVLDAEQLQELRALGRRIEEALGGPQDIEWAYEGRRLVVLQARPIVGGPAPPGTRRVWDNANVVESYPGLTLPLTFSFASRGYARAFARVARSFLAPPARPGLYEELIGLVDGRVYYNLLAWYEMFAFLPGADRYRASWDTLVGVEERSAPMPVSVGRGRRAAALVASVAVLARSGSLGRRFRARFDGLRERFTDAGRGEATVDEVLARFRALEEDAAGFWHLTLQNDFCALKLHQWAARLLERWTGGTHDLHRALRCGPEGLESVEPVRSLCALVEAVRSDAAARALFARDGDGAVWAALDSAERWRPLREAFVRHQREFGDRSVAELKLETVTFADDPALLVGLVRRYLLLGLAACDLDGTRSAAEPPPVRSAFARRLLGALLARTRAALRTREEMRLDRTRLFGIVRRLFRRLGVLLAEQGVLDAPGDVHYLAVGELLDLARGTGLTRDVRALVALRQAEYAGFAGAPAPPRFETRGIPRAPLARAAEPPPSGDRSLSGTGCAPGVASGRATIVRDPERAEPGRDRILVAASTDPGWVFLMMSSAGIVVERGSLLSHTAIVGRELGIPTVVGATGATCLIPDGARLTIDGGSGSVRWA